MMRILRKLEWTLSALAVLAASGGCAAWGWEGVRPLVALGQPYGSARHDPEGGYPPFGADLTIKTPAEAEPTAND
jgi:hypothetical protein